MLKSPALSHVAACRLALDLSTDKTLKEARFDRHFVRDLVWSRHQLEELAERRFRAAQVRYFLLLLLCYHTVRLESRLSGSMVWSRHQLDKLAERRFRAAHVCIRVLVCTTYYSSTAIDTCLRAWFLGAHFQSCKCCCDCFA
jgi:hypothetical protein